MKDNKLKARAPTEWRDAFLEAKQPVLEELIDELMELDHVVQIWVRPERTYCKINIATNTRDSEKRDDIYDIQLEYQLRSDSLFDFRVTSKPKDIESNWRQKVFYDER